MPAEISNAMAGNHLLASLGPEDRDVLSAHLEPVTLDRRLVMEMPGEPVAHVYFPLSGIGSGVTVGWRHLDQRIETNLFGREGMSGLAVVLCADRGQNEVYVQLPGDGLRLEARDLRHAMDERPSIRAALLRYVHVAQIQTSFTALSNGRDRLETRLARWLLMAHDRVDGNELALTHEFLALMLGVRRAGVTVATHDLEGEGLIRAERGVITVLDRAGLDAVADGSYGAPEAEYERLIGHPLRREPPPEP